MARYHSDPEYRQKILDRSRKAAADRSPEQKRLYNLWHMFRLTGEQFDALVEAQGGRCGVCLRVQDEPRKMHVDHDHSCCNERTASGSPKKTCGKCVRGLLCQPCNLGLGLWRDNTQHMLNAIDYLLGGNDMGKAVQSLLFRWDTNFVDDLRSMAGPRGMSKFVKEAVEDKMRREQATPLRFSRDVPPGVTPASSVTDDDFDTWGD